MKVQQTILRVQVSKRFLKIQKLHLDRALKASAFVLVRTVHLHPK